MSKADSAVYQQLELEQLRNPGGGRQFNLSHSQQMLMQYIHSAARKVDTWKRSKNNQSKQKALEILHTLN